MPLHNDTHRDSLPVRLGDRKYNIDITRLARATIDPIRQGFDTVGQPGEQSLNQAGVWKRSRNDWELGAGQREADTPESGLRRFHESTGINPWVKNELTLLKTTADAKTAGSSTNLYLATAESSSTRYVYMCNGSNIEYSDDDGATWSGSPITNPCGAAIIGIASNGTDVYVAGNGKVVKVTGTTHATTSDGTTHWTFASVDGVWVANGYLIASKEDRLNVLSVGSTLTANSDIASDTFNQVDSWQSVIGTPVGIFAAGNRGSQGRIYYIGINDSTSALNVPVIAAELPAGEKVNTLAEYGGLLIIGTSKGFRLAAIEGAGYLTYGPLVEITNGVNVVLPQGEFVYFGWDNYDSPFDTTDRSGLGRISLAELTSQLVPAYASDLMVESTTASIQGIVISNGNLLFSVKTIGCKKEASTYVTTGSINEGRFRWGITELKVAVSVDLRHDALLTGESVKITVESDDGNTDSFLSDEVGKRTPIDADGNPNVKPITGVDGEYLIPTLTLASSSASTTPTLYRWTVRAIPMPFVAEVIQLPIILTTQTRHDNRDIYQDIYEDYNYIRTLLEKRSLATFIMGNETKNVYVAGISYEQGSVNKWSDSAQRKYEEGGRRDRWLEGILTVQLITVQTGVTLVPTDASSTG